MLLFKITLAPILIAIVSLAARRWGPGIGGWLLGLPLNSGPIIFFILLEQGPRFASGAARGSLLGILAWAAFCLAYALCCVRMSWWWSTVIGWLAYFVIAAALLPVSLGPLSSFALVSAVLVTLLIVFPRPTQSDAPVAATQQQDLWLRMLTASVMVVSLTGVAKALGPTRSGILTAFPAYTTILAVFSHRHGAASAVQALKGVTAGLFTAATFLMTLSISLVHIRGGLAFALATAAALTVQMAGLLFVRRRV